MPFVVFAITFNIKTTFVHSIGNITGELVEQYFKPTVELRQTLRRHFQLTLGTSVMSGLQQQSINAIGRSIV